MKKNITLIFLYFAVGVLNNADAYFYADTNSTAPIAYYAEDSLPTRIGRVNPVSTIAAVSSLLAPIAFYLSNSTNFFFDYYFGVILTGSLLILGFIGGVIGGFVRKKLLTGKYANYPEPRKLPLGKGRSAIGILGFLLVLSTLLILLMGY